MAGFVRAHVPPPQQNQVVGPYPGSQAQSSVVQELEQSVGGEARALAQCTRLHMTCTAPETAKRAEEVARRFRDTKVLAATLQDCAEAFAGAERFTEALDLAKKALELVEEDEAAKASALACLASVHLQTGHYDVNNPGICSRPRGLKEAVKVSEDALEIHRKLNDQSGEIGGVQRIFHAHLLGQDGPNALLYAREYMELAQRSPQKENLGPALVSLCQAHFLCRDYEEAEQANLEAISIFEKAASRFNVALCEQMMIGLKQKRALWWPAAWQKSEPQVVFENEGLQVINKPPYWNCRWTRQTDDVKADREWITYDRRSLEEIVNSDQPEHLDLYVARRFGDFKAAHWRDRPEEGAGFLHRLDGQTSGLMIRGKNPIAFAALQEEFFGQKVKKGYLALAHGCIEIGGPFRIDARLSYSRQSRTTMVDATRGEAAETFVMPLARARWNNQIYTFCAVRIVSGKTHQIRKHLEHLHHPLVADCTYNPNGYLDKRWCPRLFLHAYELWINEEGTQHRFVAPLALDLRMALKKLRVEHLCEPGRLREVPTTGLVQEAVFDELMELQSQTFDQV